MKDHAKAEADSLERRPHLTVLHDCFAGKIHSPEAAAKLASAALALDVSLDAQLGQLWHLLLQIACKHPQHQDKLVDIVVDISHLPDVADRGCRALGPLKGLAILLSARHCEFLSVVW
ncbi:hypothetical protein GB937_000795 [Aspergillus fischeri]|nr:hypothetical protein GB937_000795 [Aspergillus fischeri]